MNGPSGNITIGRCKVDEYGGEDADLVEDELLLSVLLLSKIENELLEVVVAVVETAEGVPGLPFLPVDSR
jgi:hypothetical protein